MTRRRRLLADLILLLILGGQATALVLDREIWPFSPYPMFSDLRRGPRITRLWLYGVLAGGEEVPLTEREALKPLRIAGVTEALSRLHGAPLREALRDLLKRYDTRRHPGPPIEAIRLYRMTWAIDLDAANRDRPLTRALLGEARR